MLIFLEFPNDSHNQKDIIILKKQQYKLVKHAFSFPEIKTVLYTTRSTHREENEQIVEDIGDFVGQDWKLKCVLPQIESEKVYDYEIGKSVASFPYIS